MSDAGLGNPVNNSNVIQQGDIATRLRRFTRGVGNLGTFLGSEIHPEVAVGNVAADPYQSEYNTFAFNVSQAAVAAQNGVCGFNARAPVTLVEALWMWAGASQTLQILTQRPFTTSAGGAFSSLTAAPLNNGGHHQNLLATPQAVIVQTSAAGGPSGQFITQGFPVVANTPVLFQFPDPVVLYGPPFSGSPTNGDSFLIAGVTVNISQNAIIFVREYPQLDPS